MPVHRSGSLFLAAALAAVGCKGVDQRDPAPVLAIATFNPDTATIPFPNDLILQAAPGLPDSPTRTSLMGLIDIGGFPVQLAALTPPAIAVPVRTEIYDEATGEYTPGAPPTGFDADTINAGTVALVQLDTDPPTTVATQVLPYDPAGGALLFRPATGSVLAPGRYVFALRGGSNGVKTDAGVPLEADLPIALVAPDKDLSNPDNQPPGGLSDEQVVALERLRGTFSVAMDWSRVAVPAVCLQALGVTTDRCWLPPVTAIGQPLPTPGLTAAFAGVDQVFPHEQVASIQTFEVVIPPEAAVQGEVSP